MMVTTEKTCTFCHQTKPLEAFAPHPGGALGRTTRCRECLNELRRQANMQTCVRCRRHLEATAFGWRRSAPGGRNRECKACNQQRRQRASESRRPPCQPPEACARCERPARLCVFPRTRGQIRACSVWCIDCHEAFRRTLAPHQAAAEARRWEVPRR
jgi:hypothetical protein